MCYRKVFRELQKHLISQCSEECIDVFSGRSPTGADAYCGVCVVYALPGGEEEFLAEALHGVVLENGELLVGVTLH